MLINEEIIEKKIQKPRTKKIAPIFLAFYFFKIKKRKKK